MKKILLFCLIAFVEIVCINSANAQFSNYLKMPVIENVTFSEQPVNVRTLPIVKVPASGLEGNILGDSYERFVTVYLPPGYDAVNDRYPVIYLLGEFASDHGFWFGGYDALIYNLTGKLDYLINTGKINPVIVVSPSNNNKYKGSWFTNSSLAGNWEDFNAKDLVSFIDNNFRTISRAESRGIAGWSMGGYGAVTLAMKHPDVFSSVYSIIGSLLDFQHRLFNYAPERNDLKKAAKLTREKLSLSGNLLYCFSLAIAFAPDVNSVGYGELPFNAEGELKEDVWQKWLAHNPITQIPVFKENLAKLRALALECGTGEPNVHKENVSFSNALTENGIEHEINVHGGDYSYSIFNRMDSHVFPFFSTNLVNHFITKDKILLCEADTLSIKMFDKDGKLYITPLNIPETLEDIMSRQIFSVETGPLETVKFTFNDLVPGSYLAYGVTDDGFITVPERFTVSNEIPVMTVRFSDKHTGEAITGCKIFINASEYLTDQNGEVSVSGCGKRLVLLNGQGYSNCSATFMVYSDTLVTMETVKNSFLKVIDKATGNPVYRASLSCRNGTTGTDKNGIAVIKVLPGDEKMTFMASHPEYFDQEYSIDPKYNGIVTITLTRKIAYVSFLIADESGPLTNQEVKFCSSTLFTNSSGIVKFSRRPAMKEYTYSVNRAGFNPVQETFILEIDTLIEVKLLPVVANQFVATEQNENFVSGSYLLTNLNIESETGLRVFPNPVKDVLYIESPVESEFTVKILTMNGKEMFDRFSDCNNLRIDMSHYVPGLYMLIIKSENQIITKKIIKI
jgi:S-formylglutathione hydrolase